jgi:hypothetical protein
MCLGSKPLLASATDWVTQSGAPEELAPPQPPVSLASARKRPPGKRIDTACRGVRFPGQKLDTAGISATRWQLSIRFVNQSWAGMRIM